MLLQGIIPPITTPFYPDGNVYYKKLEHNVERYSRTPASAMVVLGSTGESVMLSDEERRQVFKTARESAAPNKVLIAGTGMESAAETLRLTEYAAELGYDIALVRTPHFYRKQMLPANLLAFYRIVADRSPLPVMLYNVPPFTAYDMPAELIAELAEHPRIIGLKESSGDLDKVRTMIAATRRIKRSATVTETFEAVTPRMRKTAEDEGQLVPLAALAGAPSSAGVSLQSGLRTRQKEVGFQIVVGAGPKFLACLQAGAVAGVMGFADAAPTACYEIYAAWKEGDEELARLKQERIAAAAQRIAADLGIAAIKYAMDLNGYYGGPVRLPLLPLTGEVKAEVESLMADLRN